MSTINKAVAVAVQECAHGMWWLNNIAVGLHTRVGLFVFTLNVLYSTDLYIHVCLMYSCC